MRPTPPTGGPEHAERVVDEWSHGGQQRRLVERGGSYRLEVWELYRWVSSHDSGLQAVARRLDEVTATNAAEKEEPPEVIEFPERRKVAARN